MQNLSVMIDFVSVHFRDRAKYEVEETINTLQNLPDISRFKNRISSATQTIDPFTGMLNHYPLKMKIQNMDLNCYEATCIVQNSLHKLHNYRLTGQEHNHNEFSYTEILENLDYLERFIPNFNQGRLTRLEFGFNLDISQAAENIITSNLLMHKFSGHTRFNNYSTKCFKEFSHSDFDIKIYDKAKQYRLPRHKKILRFEVRYRSKSLHPLGIQYVDDLYRKISYRNLFLKSLERFNELQIVDDISSLPKQLSNELMQMNNPQYWASFKTRQTKSRYVRKYQELLLKNNLLTTKERIEKLLFNNYIKLINH